MASQAVGNTNDLTLEPEIEVPRSLENYYCTSKQDGIWNR